MYPGLLKYKIITWGCQMNIHDSEVISGVLQKLGYCPADSLKEADLIILNTCCVRENAERKVYGRIAQLKQFKQKNPNLIIAVSGCMIQQPHVTEYISEHLPYVDLVFGIHNVHRLPELIKNARQANLPVIEVTRDNTQLEENLPIKRGEGVKAWVNIIYGCNNFCSYCIVPYVRGREKSRKPEDILKEVEELSKQGFLEINLLGQNVNSYGKDLEEPITFPELLRRVNSIDGIRRIRFITSHPKDLSDELIMAMRDCEKVCEHIHLPVQAGSNRILEKMNRRYTREHYISLVEKLRKAVPEVAITTDIIVGFPGETEEDFRDTLDLVKTVEFDSAFTFIYSRRQGTPAAEMEDQVDEEVKSQRLERLMKVQDAITARKNMELKGKILEVLVEGVSKGNEERLSGRTRTNKLVNFDGPRDLIGKLVNVRITQPHTWSLLGQFEE
ncbi:MAG: tRNA-2-methylthio-N6-dimethylallyladenosine synthase [Thermoanaerobacteraceae bacterium]|uniref:tRNA (N6-isopentenyl adenosine(37)-C2)-methylthiotransferase MiaB n=1 Tax=Biomaibacter acetigenes TaxID=2316383 RepID=UPI002482DBF7|nr:tRNA (N6-isopentenyl adenosine(37)-C2)-methylthiotransferase MiaB [Biomaibacter acetigenes]MDK2878096.1 tRNA-2-methylthio-N6-dimethylallyladenosine synthase [Thermoanaerobacteraceae bacterium]MDN5311514.1 tRNA-2-methylthio-N6-dimethylallyladenosine synthase [Thermoanaerobacteraceae bacterium]